MKKQITPFLILGTVLLNGCFIRDLLFDPVDPRDKIKMSNLIKVEEKYNSSSDVSNRTDTKKVSDVYGETYDQLEFSQYGTNITYSKKLPSPKDSAKGVSEIADIFDYYAFYGDGKPFEITIPITNQDTAKKAIYAAFYQSKLCAGTTGLNYEYNSKAKKYYFQLLYNTNANSYRPKTTSDIKMSLPYSFPTNNGNRAEDFADFPYLVKNTKGEVDVYNSEQVLYALENGFNPIPMAESPAEALLTKAKSILTTIIKNDMTEFDKLAAIYSYVISHATFDKTSDRDSTYTVEEVYFPDYIASSFRAYYAEGALFDGCCNSHGYAKAFNILANMEGIASIKVTSRFNDDTTSINSTNYVENAGAQYANLGYCYTQNSTDQKYYVVDPYLGSYESKVLDGVSYNTYRRPAIMQTYDKWVTFYNKITDRYHSDDFCGKETIDFSQYFKIGSSFTYRVNNYSNLSSYVRDVLAYVRANTDLSYKTNNTFFQVNLTINEIENNLSSNPDYFSNANNVSSVLNSVTNNTNSTSYRIAYREVGYYDLKDTGVILIIYY